MRARLAYATAALCAKPDILLVDEVLAVGDHEFRERCLDHLRAFQRSGGTTVLVSHEESLVRSLAGSAVWLSRGRIAGSGPVDSVMRAYLGSGESGVAVA
jgi:ABC-type polysaccharide/polyol phosphate transport system ATPase subunit